MPEEITEALTRIASALPPVAWRPAAELRARATMRRRRRIAVSAIAVAVLATVAVAPVRAWWAHNRPESAIPGAATGDLSSYCPGGLAPARIEMPERASITVNVYSGAPVVSVSEINAVSDELRHRGYHVTVLTETDGTMVDANDDVAVIRYGPKVVGAAWVVMAEFPDARMDFEIYDTADFVDVVIGSKYVELSTTTEVNQHIAANGRPTAPDGTCAVG